MRITGIGALAGSAALMVGIAVAPAASATTARAETFLTLSVQARQQTSERTLHCDPPGGQPPLACCGLRRPGRCRRRLRHVARSARHDVLQYRRPRYRSCPGRLQRETSGFPTDLRQPLRPRPPHRPGLRVLGRIGPARRPRTGDGGIVSRISPRPDPCRSVTRATRCGAAGDPASRCGTRPHRRAQRGPSAPGGRAREAPARRTGYPAVPAR